MYIFANNNNLNSPNFKSKIHLVGKDQFWNVMYRTGRNIPKVDSPWTPKEIVKAPFAWTEEVRTCTAGGIVTKNLDGSKDVVMFHLNPDDVRSQNPDKVKEGLMEKIGNSKPIQALVVGSKDTDGDFKYSGEYFDEIAYILKQLKIPTTKLKGLPMGGYEANVLYDTPRDTWTILNTRREDLPIRNPERNGFTGFKNVVLSALDWLSYD